MFVCNVISRIISSVKPLLKPLTLPSACLLCGSQTKNAPAHYLCLPCYKQLPILPYHCKQCGQFLPKLAAFPDFCHRCLKHPPYFDRLFALFPYEFPVIALIKQLKFQAQLTHANFFAHLLSQHIRTAWHLTQPLPDLLLPVPLHQTRLKTRGFNQALEIAKPISKSLNIPIAYPLAIRHKNTAPQSSLNEDQRKINIQEAFSIAYPLSGEHIAIIDDVVTTGETVNTLSRALKAHGAGEITIWCCARRG